ncbi:hypothetical protein [uncultured Bradyrhizobium sp.]|jgi:hypothetical protein|uniref:hypothetical protein n=1 Tax=uncultured Bradyrhizobium sp. TaxID=199684 RepID=UPI00261B7E55|nr:hypothetical protein [uncultured Bradyrhizobium sp.]
MISLHDLLRQMEATCRFLNRPTSRRGDRPAIKAHSVLVPVEADGSAKPFEPWVVEAFRGVKHASETGEPFVLINCLKDGKSCSLIALSEGEGEHMTFKPLFIAVTDDMQFQPYPLDQMAA